MRATTVMLICLMIFVWGLFSARLGRAALSAPIVFVVLGVLLSEGMQAIDPEVAREITKVLAEVTLVWVLFADASRIGLRELRADAGLYVRLLAVGLPLTVAAGTVLAMVLFGGVNLWLALLIGTALAPTDAALGAAVMTNPAVPDRVRRALNIESGLNDGIVTPVVSIAIAGAATAESLHGAASVGGACIELAIGLAIGALAGLVGGQAMRIARRRGWAAEELAGPAVLALALAIYVGAVWLEGNGFVAAFVAGLVFSHFAGRRGPQEVFYVEQTAGLVSLLTWLLFGAIAVATVIDHANWQVVTYAVLSLTVVRMLPVALALAGSGMSAPTVAFIGWFGPRGLASVIFALLALEDLHAGADQAVAVIGMTVLLSVFAHGLSASGLATRYGAVMADSPPVPGDGPAPAHPSVRGLLNRQTDAEAAPPGPGVPR